MESLPASPQAASSASSPMGSPVTPGSGAELTPRSKVRALLALSDDSDFDGPTNSPSKASSHKASSINVKRQRTAGVTPPHASETSASSDADSDSSDVVPTRRMGGIVAKLHGKLVKARSAAEESSLDPNNSTTEDANYTSITPRSGTVTPRKTSAQPRSAASSPGLFVSPHPASVSSVHAAEPAESNAVSDFRSLKPKLKKKRHIHEQRKQRSASSRPARSATVSDNEEADSGAEDRLTQQTRPSKRKASKKALEEMHRETQRMARNQQLSHQAQVRKKITKHDLFQRFNFGQENKQELGPPIHSKMNEKSSEDEFMMSGALLSSDADPMVSKDTPPTSPVRSDSMKLEMKQIVAPVKPLPITSSPVGKPKLAASKITSKIASNLASDQAEKTVKRFNIVMPDTRYVELDFSDDDVETSKPNKALAMLDHLPIDIKKDSSHLLRLRHLANLTSPGRKRKRTNHITAAELQVQLREKARQQAMHEKAERIAQLQAKGIHVQTFEEREKEQLELENLLEKARVEAVDIAKKEKAAAKKAGVDVDEDDLLDDEDDDDWDSEDEAEQTDAELAISGSEDEDEEADDEKLPAPDGPSFFDNEAGESEGEDISQNIMEVFSIFKQKPTTVKNGLHSSEAEHADAMDTSTKYLADNTPDAYQATISIEAEADTDSDVECAVNQVAHRSSRRRVVMDDEEEEVEDDTRKHSQATQQSPNDVTRAAFGFNAQPAAFGLSQLLESTLAGTDSQEADQSYDPEQDSLAFLRDLPNNSAPQFATPSHSQGFVPDSQKSQPSQVLSVQETQITLGISQLQESYQTDMDASPAKMSEMIEPTQDAGFALSRIPSAKHEEPTSTVDTVVMQESPIAKRKGRLVRRSNVVADLSDDESVADDHAVMDTIANNNAFGALFDGAKKSAARIDFDKKKSAAKELVEEQAEESEDEYAGLGGASDDESNGEVDEEMQKMMDDSNVNVNEQALQALHADNQRLEDEKRLNQLYKDITTGGLRRKRGAAGMDDLSDHEDDAAERRRRKQEEFARMRRALLADEKIGKIAQNPKQQAFFHAIEDRDELDGLDYMDRHVTIQPSLENSIAIPQAVDMSLAPEDISLKPKILSDYDVAAEKENIPPRNPRRTAASESVSRPTTLAEIRESLSFFLEDSVPETQLDDADTMDDVDFAHMLHRSDTNTSMNSISSKSSVINRLLRTDSEDSLSAKPLAFQAESATVGPSFKVPSLLRRATNLSTASNSSTGAGTSTRSNENGIRMGGSRKSNIHYQAREAERMRSVDIAEQKRKAKVKRTVLSSKGRSIFGLLRKESSGFE